MRGRRIAAIVVTVNGITAFELNRDGSYGSNLVPIRDVKSPREAAERLMELGFGLNFRLDACIGGLRVSSLLYSGGGGNHTWYEASFSQLEGFPRYPGPDIPHTGDGSQRAQVLCA